MKFNFFLYTSLSIRKSETNHYTFASSFSVFSFLFFLVLSPRIGTNFPVACMHARSTHRIAGRFHGESHFAVWKVSSSRLRAIAHQSGVLLLPKHIHASLVRPSDACKSETIKIPFARINHCCLVRHARWNVAFSPRNDVSTTITHGERAQTRICPFDIVDNKGPRDPL